MLRSHNKYLRPSCTLSNSKKWKQMVKAGLFGKLKYFLWVNSPYSKTALRGKEYINMSVTVIEVSSLTGLSNIE